MVRKIGPACGDDRTRVHGAGGAWVDFRVRVGQGEDDRHFGHFGDHVGGQHAGAGQAKEHVRPVDHVKQCARLIALGVFRLLVSHVELSAFVNKALQVAKEDVLALHAQFEQHVQASDTGSAAAGGHDFDVGKILFRDAQGVCDARADDDGGAVLVVVKDGNVHPLAADFFDDKAVGGFDVFKVDRAESGFKRTDDFGQFDGVWFVQFDIEAVDIGEFLEQDGLAFHDRLGRQRADIAKAQHGGAVGDDADQVAARGVIAGRGGVFFNLEAGLCDTGGIGARQIAAVSQWLGRADFQFAGARELVVVQSRLAQAV